MHGPVELDGPVGVVEEPPWQPDVVLRDVVAEGVGHGDEGPLCRHGERPFTALTRRGLLGTNRAQEQVALLCSAEGSGRDTRDEVPLSHDEQNHAGDHRQNHAGQNHGD